MVKNYWKNKKTYFWTNWLSIVEVFAFENNRWGPFEKLLMYHNARLLTKIFFHWVFACTTLSMFCSHFIFRAQSIELFVVSYTEPYSSCWTRGPGNIMNQTRCRPHSSRRNESSVHECGCFVSMEWRLFQTDRKEKITLSRSKQIRNAG